MATPLGRFPNEVLSSRGLMVSLITGNSREWTQKPDTKPRKLHSIQGHWRRAFKRRYGNLLSILEVKLAPTLEEYERLLGLPLAKSLHYFYRGHYPFWTLVAKLLRVSEEKKPEWPGKRLHQLLGEEDWLAVMDVYRLLVYGIVLFPHLEDYIDMATINVFLAKRDRGENPVIAILVDTYCTLNYCCERNGKSLRCCTHLIYLWMTAHLFHSKCKTMSPLEDLKWNHVKVGLDPIPKRSFRKKIRWYPKWNEREEVIVKCGGFPNVPLMGTQGGINYNLELVPRQAGYPMILAPLKEATTPFIIYGMGVQNGDCFKRIRHA
ncbi:hypothetical protein CR513_48025, partial [Mucuna pruriens]